jgi:hypothetical protein
VGRSRIWHIASRFRCLAGAGERVGFTGPVADLLVRGQGLVDEVAGLRAPFVQRMLGRHLQQVRYQFLMLPEPEPGIDAVLGRVPGGCHRPAPRMLRQRPAPRFPGQQS